MIADKNLGPSGVVEEGLRWISLMENSFRVEGFPWGGVDPSGWKRLPDAAWYGEGVGDALRHVAAQPAGGLVRFQSDSAIVGIRTEYGRMEESRQSPAAATRGFDVYVNGRTFCGNMAPDGRERFFESSFRLPEAVCRENPGFREISIYLPLQLPLEHLEIGLSRGAQIRPAVPRPKRVVFYGSSITQGFCASRPGLTYPARVCRALGVEMVNMGFGGNCRGEKEVARAIAGLSMDAFVYDYDHNADGPDELASRHGVFLREILAIHPRLPVVVMSSPNFHNDPAYFGERKALIAATCRAACLEGYNVHFLPGDSFWGRGDERTVDRLHPNDDGFARMAGAVARALVLRIFPAFN